MFDYVYYKKYIVAVIYVNMFMYVMLDCMRNYTSYNIGTSPAMYVYGSGATHELNRGAFRV